MYKALVKVTITDFQKTNGEFGPDRPSKTPYVQARLSDLRDISAKPAPKPVFWLTDVGDDQELHVQVPCGYKDGAMITYQLADSRHVILGIAFAPKDTDGKHVGQQEFPLVSMNRDPFSSEMAVVDMCDDVDGKASAFSYGILIQEVVTGNIGIYDPTIINDPPEPTY